MDSVAEELRAASGMGSVPVGIRVLRNAPAAVSVLAKFLVGGRVSAASALLRVAPGWLLGAWGRSRRFPVLAGLSLAALGRPDAAAERLVSLGSRSRGRGAAVDALVALHRPDLARAMVDGAPGVVDARAHARLLVEEGHYHRALLALGPSPRHRLLRQAIEGELASLDPGRRVPSARSATRSSPDLGRVVHFVTTSLPEAQTGYTIRTHGIAAAQVAAGWQTEVVTRLGFPVDRGRLTARQRQVHQGVSYLRDVPWGPLPLDSGARLDLACRRARERLERRSPAVLHAHSKHDNAQVALAAGRSLGLPVVYEVRGALEETWRARGGDPASERYVRSRDAETACMIAADAVVTLSRTMLLEVISRGVAPEAVFVVPNAVEAAALAEPMPPAAARRRAGLGEGDIIVGIAGTLNAYEGFETVIRAAAGLHDPRVSLLVVGDGPARRDWERVAGEAGVRARFTGRVPHREVRDLVAAMDLFCVPRRDTAVTRLVPPLKPLEAAACGVPVLMSDLAPLQDLVDEGPIGWTAPAGSIPGWTAQLEQLLYDRSALRTVGAQGRAWVLQNRTWPIVTERYGSVYEYAAARAAGWGR